MLLEEWLGAGAGARTGNENDENDENKTEDRMNFQTYNDHYIEIKYPPGWKVSKDEGTITISSSLQNAAGAGARTGNENDENDENNRRLSDGEYGKFVISSTTTRSKELLLQIYRDDPHVIRSGETTSNGREALFFIVELPNRKQKEFHLIDNEWGSIYSLIYSAPIDRYNESIANYMIDSFKIIGH